MFCVNIGKTILSRTIKNAMIPRVIITWQDWRTLLSSTVVQNWFLKKDSRKQASYLQLGDLRCNIRTQIDALKICTWLLKYRKRWNQTFNQRIIFSKKIEKWRKQKQPSRGVLKICSRTSFPKNTSEGLLLQTLAKTRQYENLLQKCVWLIYNRMRNFITTNAGQN